MANDKNSNELNRLNKNGNLQNRDITKEDKLILEDVEKGKKTTDEMPQHISEDRILAEVKNNDIYKMISSVCVNEGYPINNKILILMEKKLVKPSELEDELNGIMQKVISDVNADTHYAIFFTDEGKVNVEESVHKAQLYNLKVPTFIRSLVEDSGNRVEDLKSTERLLGMDIARNKSIEECALLDQLFKPHVKKYRETFNNIFNTYYDEIDIEKTENGKDVLVTGDSEDVTVLLNILNRLDGWIIELPSEIGKRDTFVLDMLRIYNYLKDPNLMSKIPDNKKEMYSQLIANAKTMIERRFEDYPGGKITDNDKIELIIKDLHIDRSEIEDITKTQIYSEVKDDLQQISVGEVTLDVKEQRKRVSIDTVMSICKISDYSLHFTGTTNKSLIRRTSVNNEKIVDTVAKLYPDYAEKAKENAKIDGYALVRLNALREIEAENILLENKDNPKHEEPNVYGGMSIFKYNKLRVAVGILNSQDFSENLRELAVNTIKEYLPEVEIDDELTRILINNSDSQKLNLVSDKVQQEAMYKTFFGKNNLNILSGNDFAFSGMALIDSRAKGKMLKAMHTAVSEGKDLDIEVLESEKYKKLVEDGINKYDTKFFTSKKLEYLVHELKKHARIADEKQYKKDKNIDIDKSNKIDEDDIVFAKKLIETAKLLEGKNVSAIDRLVKEYLVDYIPQAFDKNGELDLREIDKYFEEFLFNNGCKREDIPDVVAQMEDDINKGFNDEIESYKITTDVVTQAKQAENKIRTDLGYETRLEQVEDTAMFVNYILSKKDNLSKESREELEGHVQNIQEKLDKQHEMILKCAKGANARLIGEHENFDKTRVKTKFVYLEKEARKVVATERINEATARFKKANRINPYLKEEIQGILGTYMGVLNDYKNEELKVEDYNELMNKLKKLMVKVDPTLIDEYGNIDEDKALEIYNNVNGTDFVDVDSAIEKEETELLMRYTRRLSKEIGTSELTYRNVITDKDLYVNSKIHEKLQEDVHLNTEMTNMLISEVWQFVSADLNDSLTPDDVVEYIKNLALIEGKYGKKDLNKKGLSYEAGNVQELQKKTLGIARMKLIEFFPGVAREGDTFDRTRLENELKKYLIENDPSLKEQLENCKDVFEVLTRNKEENNVYLMGPMQRQKTTEELLAEANAVLKGEVREKTYEDNVLVASMAVKIVEEIGKPNMGDRLLYKLTKRMSEEEKNKFVQDCNNRNIDESTTNAMRRVTGLINIDRYNAQLQMDAEGKSKTPMNQDDIADYLQVAVGALVSCKELPNSEINSSIQKDITDFIKKLAPKTVNSKGNVDFKKLMNTVNDLRAQRPSKNGNYRKIVDKKEFLSDSVNKANIRLGIELFRDEIDSRYTNKYYVPRSNDKSISKTDMDRVMEERGEEIVVDQTPEIIAEQPKSLEETEISGDELTTFFEENAVEVGEEQQTVEGTSTLGQEKQTDTKIEQQIEESSTGIGVETIQGPEEGWQNLPVKQGFIKTVLNNVKKAITDRWNDFKKNILNRNSNSNATSSGSSSTSSSGGINVDNKTEQDVGKQNDWVQKATLDVKAAKDKTEKSKVEKGESEQEHDEEVL